MAEPVVLRPVGVNELPSAYMYSLQHLAAEPFQIIVAVFAMPGTKCDIETAAEAIGDRMTLLGNLNPLTDVQEASDDDLAATMRAQIKEGTKARGFIVSTGSPITPLTPLARVQRFLELGRDVSAEVLAK